MNRRSFLRRIVGAAAAVAVAPRVVEAAVEALPAAETEMFKVYIASDAAEAMGAEGIMFKRCPQAPVTFTAIKRLAEKMRKDLGVEPFRS